MGLYFASLTRAGKGVRATILDVRSGFMCCRRGRKTNADRMDLLALRVDGDGDRPRYRQHNLHHDHGWPSAPEAARACPAARLNRGLGNSITSSSNPILDY